VKEFTRFGHVIQAVGSPDTALMLGHKLTGSCNLGVKRADLEHIHDIADHCASGAPERGANRYQPGSSLMTR
jgi:hypothetical protein